MVTLKNSFCSSSFVSSFFDCKVFGIYKTELCETGVFIINMKMYITIMFYIIPKLKFYIPAFHLLSSVINNLT